jgi:hypothetical protein
MPINPTERKQKYKIFAMALIGGGLLIVGIVSLILLTSTLSTSSPTSVG